MTDVELVRQRVKPGKVDRLREWMAEIEDREEEALATLRDEGMLTETAFLEDREDGTYLYYYMEAEDLDRVREQFADSDHEIDAEHKRVMETVLVDDATERVEEVLYHLANPER